MSIRSVLVRGLSAVLVAGLVLASSACRAQKDAKSGLEQARHEMVRTQIENRGISDEVVLEAMRTVPRHEFAPDHAPALTYTDRPLPIGHGQTISQPFIVAYMTQLLRAEPSDHVFEVGTGSGYQAAILGEIVDSVYTIEIVPELARTAQTRLQRLGYDNVVVRDGDGYAGWPQRAPFNGIVVTAAPDSIPPPLIDQLAPGGRMIVPVGPTGRMQQLTVVTKGPTGRIEREEVMPVRFVPFRRNK